MRQIWVFWYSGGTGTFFNLVKVTSKVSAIVVQPNPWFNRVLPVCPSDLATKKVVFLEWSYTVK